MSGISGSDRRRSAAKLGLASLLVGACVTAVLLLIPRYLAGNDLVDQGPRGLVVFATSGSDRDYYLNVRESYDIAASEMRMVFYFTAEGIEYGEDTNTQEIQVEVTFIDPSFSERIECGDGEEVEPISNVEFEDLSQGTRNAVSMDAMGGSNSATNYEGEAGDQTETTARSHSYGHWAGSLWLLKDGEWRGSPEEYWVGSCVLPSSYFMREGRQDDIWSTSPSLLPPQINWTSIDLNTDYQSSLYVDARVDRAHGMTVREAYPNLSSTAEYWSYVFEQHWSNSAGGEYNVGYTNQPVWIFSDRGLSDRRSLILMSVSALVGVGAAASVRIGSRTYDLLFGSMRRKIVE